MAKQSSSSSNSNTEAGHRKINDAHYSIIPAWMRHKERTAHKESEREKMCDTRKVAAATAECIPQNQPIIYSVHGTHNTARHTNRRLIVGSPRVLTNDHNERTTESNQTNRHHACTTSMCRVVQVENPPHGWQESCRERMCAHPFAFAYKPVQHTAQRTKPPDNPNNGKQASMPADTNQQRLQNRTQAHGCAECIHIQTFNMR